MNLMTQSNGTDDSDSPHGGAGRSTSQPNRNGLFILLLVIQAAVSWAGYVFVEFSTFAFDSCTGSKKSAQCSYATAGVLLDVMLWSAIAALVIAILWGVLARNRARAIWWIPLLTTAVVVLVAVALVVVIANITGTPTF